MLTLNSGIDRIPPQPKDHRIQMKPIGGQDNGGRRSGVDRRRFSYARYIPERRSGEDRRSGADRRQPRKSERAVQRQGSSMKNQWVPLKK
jgi:hypothetical protein